MAKLQAVIISDQVQDEARKIKARIYVEDKANVFQPKANVTISVDKNDNINKIKAELKKAYQEIAQGQLEGQTLDL